MSGRFHDGMTLTEARDVLRELVDEGHECPCCRQFAKVYRRKISSSMAAAIIRLTHAAPAGEPVELVAVLEHRQIADTSKLRHWGLLEEVRGRREDGSDRVGVWIVTPAGRAFAANELTVTKYRYLYGGRLVFSDERDHGPHVSIIDCLGSRFNYSELMAASSGAPAR